MDRADYNNKAQKLLEDRGTYKRDQDRPHKQAEEQACQHAEEDQGRGRHQ